MILDLIIILIIALFTFIGYKQGLVKVAIKILSFFIALIIAVMLYKVIGNMIINNTSIDDKIESTIIEKIGAQNYEDKLAMIPDSLIEEGENTVNNISIDIAQKIIYTLTFILLFIISKLLLKFVTVLTDLITKLPIIKQFDKTGGIIYGFAKGFLIVTVIFAVISLASPTIGEEFILNINNSNIASVLYNHNLLLGLIK